MSLMLNWGSGHIPTSDRSQGLPCPVMSHRYRGPGAVATVLGKGMPGVGTAMAGQVTSREVLRPVGEEERARSGYVRKATNPGRGDFYGAVCSTRSQACTPPALPPLSVCADPWVTPRVAGSVSQVGASGLLGRLTSWVSEERAVEAPGAGPAAVPVTLPDPLCPSMTLSRN